MSRFKESALKGGSSKGKELVIDIDSLTPNSKKTWSSTGFYDANKFRSYVASQAYENYFKDAPLLVERVVEQAFLLDTNIPKWIVIFFCPTLTKHTKKWLRNSMQMPFMMGMS